MLRKNLLSQLVFVFLANCLVSLDSASAQGIDTTQMPAQLVRAFPKLKLRRPVAITNAGDSSQRLFIVSEQGVISFLKNDQSATEAETFLDIEAQTTYSDKENEEGLLGLAFHPKYKENGEFFVYYTSKKAPPHTSVISRFRVSKTDPNKADPMSEEEIIRIPQPHWTHNGGCIAFGSDGFLYIALGDGGRANDPESHGQNIDTHLGSILRLNVDVKADGKNYSNPKDNPFVGKDKGRPEIFAWGFRNIWGISFDNKTNTFWAADVGQNLWEEINHVVKGNYGWRLREGKHTFINDGEKPFGETIDPIFEYSHDWGRSITGGHVYYGSRVPELTGHYVYGDYVSGRVWALKYDHAAKKVVANRPVSAPLSPFNSPLFSFGCDEKGEIYAGDAFGQLWMFDKGLPEGELPIVFEDDFETGVNRWEPLDAAQWKVKTVVGKQQFSDFQVFSQFEKKSAYKPPHRSPTNVALLKDVAVTDCEFKVRVQSTHEDYDHRDAVLVFGYQDPSHFYYVHLGRKADDHANQIFIVNDAPRKKISLTSTDGTKWDDKWHDVKVKRQVADGTIEIFFDDMAKPVMTAKDSTFTWGRVGIGTFDDTADYDNVQVRGNLKK